MKTRRWLVATLALAAALFAQRAAVRAWTNPYNVGKWDPPFDWGLAIHMQVLPNGKVMSWNYGASRTLTEARMWDPDTGLFAAATNAFTNLFCSGHVFLADGRLLTTGGHDVRVVNGQPYFMGLPDTDLYDYRDNGWTRAQDMNHGRWYPTSTALGNGEALTVTGIYCAEHCDPSDPQPPLILLNTVPQAWQTAGGWRSLPGAERPLPILYPWMYQAPDGRVFAAGPQAWSAFLDPTPPGSWSADVRSNGPLRDAGSSVMYQPGKVLAVGGGTPLATAETIDLNVPPSPGPTWSPVASLAAPRRQTTSLVLADGKVMVLGGTSGAGNDPCHPVLTPELWNPAAPQQPWRTMSAMARPRIYHLAAVLLPDARVLSAGSTAQGGGGQVPPCPDHPDQTEAEIFSPPYLFNPDGSPAARPLISAAPRVVAYGQRFAVESPQAYAVQRVTLVRLPSVTHSFDENQRFAALDFTYVPGQGRLVVKAPTNGNSVPPGDYMLFILDGGGVPSLARIVNLKRRADNVGVYRPASSTFLLTNSHTTGALDLSASFGLSGDRPLVGDWDGDGSATLGVYRPGTRTFHLRNSNTAGPADITVNVSAYGGPRDVPVAGDWDGDGIATVGLYRPGTATFSLWNTHLGGSPDVVETFGTPGDAPVVGDWDGDGLTTLGVHRAALATFYLRNGPAGADLTTITYGVPQDLPVVGDWDGNGTVSVGIYRPGNATFYLLNRNRTTPDADVIVAFGTAAGDLPLAGDWDPARATTDFADVPDNHPFRGFVERVYDEGIAESCGTSGLGRMSFCPDGALLRKFAARWLLRANDGFDYDPPPATGVFDDVPASSPFAPWIEELARRSITSGCGGGNFCPESPVTREQVAVLLLRTLEGPTYVPPACVTPTFTDVPCSSPFAPWIEELVRRQITAGCGASLFCPTSSVTRGQMSVFVERTFP